VFWRLVALLLSQPRAVAWLIARGERTPYTHIKSADGNSVYMYRFWLFNPYAPAGEYSLDSEGNGKNGWRRLFPSVRLHHIMRPDMDQDPHNHPWNSRTIILDGWYYEWRDDGERLRATGDTAVIRHDDFHRITAVHGPGGGVWTLFITWRKRHSWGFRLADGSFVHYKKYLEIR
jgi:hypothetical protein